MENEDVTNVNNLNDVIRSENIQSENIETSKDSSEQQAEDAVQCETEEDEKCYSKNDVEQIVKDQLSRQQQESEEQYNELKKGQLKLKYDKEVFKRGFPEEITDLLDYSSPEKCEESYQKTLKIIQKISDSIMDKFSPPVLKKFPDNDIMSDDEKNKKIKKAFSL